MTNYVGEVSVQYALRRGLPDLSGSREAYIDFATRHAMKENNELIPIAERVLTYEDWAAVDAAFETNDDPAFGAAPQARFANLLRELERQALAPPVPRDDRPSPG